MKINTFRFFNILLICFLVTACYKPNAKIFNDPIYKSKNSEYEFSLVLSLTNFIIEQYYTLDNDSSLLHASAIFSALNDNRHGEVYYWENNSFFGKVKIVLTYFVEQDIVCRHWIEQVAKINGRNISGAIFYKYKDKTNKACYDFKKKKWQFTNYNI